MPLPAFIIWTLPTENRMNTGRYPLYQFMSSRKPLAIILRYGLALVILFSILVNIKLVVESFGYPEIFQKDIIQEYLLAKSALSHVNPYLPMPELAPAFLGEIPLPLLPHPTPHTPAVIFLGLPFGLFTYQLAAIGWFILELTCLVLSVYLLLRWLGFKSIGKMTVLISFVALGWESLMVEVVNGQLEMILMILFLGVWLSHLKEKDVQSGIFLGVLMSIKLIGWPILLYFLLKRNWKFTLSALGSLALLNIGAGLVIGFDRILNYYLVVSQQVATLYRAYSANFSLFSIGYRLFDGTKSPALFGVEAPPLFLSPQAADIVGYLIPGFFLVFTLYLALRIKDFNLSFVILMSSSLLVNPIVWHHYLILALVPLVILGKILHSQKWPKTETIIYVLTILLLLFSRVQIYNLAYILGGVKPMSGVSVQVSFWTSLITLEPILPIIGIIWLGWRLKPQQISNVDQGLLSS